MDTPDPGVRLALLDTLREQFTDVELTMLQTYALDDPLLFIAEVVSFHQAGKISLSDTDLRSLVSLLALLKPEEQPANQS